MDWRTSKVRFIKAPLNKFKTSTDTHTEPHTYASCLKTHLLTHTGLQGFKVPQLTSASLTSTKGNGKLLYPLFETEKLQSLSLNGTVHKGPEYASLPALTHLVWNESFGLYAWQIQSLAAASSLKSLETDEYIPAAQGSISEFYDYCPR